ncbi:MAG TPA: DNA polymerase III subunit alpha [Acidimicrobiales bacterium]|nr:DNA polymerase III subunit alpha [Acidimicrobiales bacterium]
MTAEQHGSFVHLHTHTEYSMLDGAARVDELVARAAGDGQPALAITDHGNMYGVLDFYDTCRRQGVNPIVGTEAYMAGSSRFERPARRGRIDDTGGDGERGEKLYYHLILLAETTAGYRNLIQLSSQAYLEGYWYKPRMDWELLERYHEGLIATTGCLGGVVLQALLNGDEDRATKLAGRLQDIFGRDNLFVELQDHGLAEQRRTNPSLVEIARAIGAPLVATNDSHYCRREDHVAHDALLCVQTGATIDDPRRFKFEGEEHYLKTAAEMRRLFAELPEACDNTLWIAERAHVEIEPGLPTLPQFPVPEEFRAGTYEASATAYLRHLTYAGARERYGSELPTEVVERLEYELGVIATMGFSAYFLVVWDLIAHARRNGIRVGPGRGSAAGCCVAYCLRIVDLDPIRYDLLFERFLNPGRKQMPDIDMDFDERYRSEMIRYAAERYGWDRVAQIVTFSTIKARAAVRDASRVLGYPYGLGDKIAKAMPPLVMGRDTPLRACLEKDEKYEDGYANATGLREMYESDPDARKVIDVARGLEGLRRQDGIHAAAVVITHEPLTEYLPIQRKPDPGADPADAPIVTQYEMHGVERLGLLKMDFLGLRNLSVIEKALDLIEASTGERPDIDALPLDDGATLEMLRRGDSIGVFQLEGGPMRSLMRSLAPTSFDDVAALVALYRPGPMAANMHRDYADRKNGRKPITYLHPDLAEVWGDTYGLCLSGSTRLWDPVAGRLRRLDEISHGDEVHVQGVDSANRSVTRRVTHWVCNGERETWRLELANGTAIEGTAEHPVLTERGWKALGELGPEDHVAVARRLMAPVVPRTADPDRLRVLGCLIAGGSSFVPELAFGLDDDSVATLLAALWDCDGYAGPRFAHYRTVSRRLAEDVQLLLLRLGVQAPISDATYQDARDGHDIRAYQVTVLDGPTFSRLVLPKLVHPATRVATTTVVSPGTTLDRASLVSSLKAAHPGPKRPVLLAAEISKLHLMPYAIENRPRIEELAASRIVEAFHVDEMRPRLRLAWVRVERVAPAGIQKVYDITVDEVHNFVANGVVVHNCIYQEELMRVAQRFAGYSLEEADNLRKACLPEGSLVLTTAHGYVPIEQLMALSDRRVQVIDTATATTRLIPVDDVWPVGTKPVYRITTATGYTMRATAEHRFLVEDRWTELAEIRAGDLVAIAGRTETRGGSKVSDAEVDLAALLISEGNLPEVGAGVDGPACFANTDPGLLDVFELALKEGFDVSPARVVSESGVVHLTFAPAVLGQLPAIAGGLGESGSKQIPMSIVNAPTEQVARFLGLSFCCDGWTDATGTHFGSRSEDVCRSVKRMLLRLGVVSSLTRSDEGADGTPWRVSIVDKGQARRFVRAVLPHLTTSKLEKIDSPLCSEPLDDPRAGDLLRDTVTSVEYEGDLACFDFQMSDGDHPYAVVEDFLVHNCGKKIRALIAAEREKFVAGCVAKGYGETLGTQLFDIVEPFADYAFNKSHSYGYGFVAYQTAWLKANHPVEYLAALLSSVKDDKDKMAVYLAECRSLGIAVQVPDVNVSASDFSARRAGAPGGATTPGAVAGNGPGAITIGLSAVRNVGEGIVSQIVAEREKNGPFADFHDFCCRVDPAVLNKRAVESLVKAGAFDSLGHPRKGLCLVFEDIVDRVLTRRREEELGISTLFSLLEPEQGGTAGPGSFEEARLAVPEVEFGKSERLALEKEMLGLYVSDHPLMGVEAPLRRLADTTIRELLDSVGGGAGSDPGGSEGADAATGGDQDASPGPVERGRRAGASRGSAAGGGTGGGGGSSGDGWSGSRTVGGVVTGLSRRYTRKNELMATFVLEDLEAAIEVFVFAKVMAEYGHLLEEDGIVLVRGRLDVRDDQPKLVASEIRIPTLVPDGSVAPLDVSLPMQALTDSVVKRLRELVAEHPGSVPLHLHLGTKVLRLPPQFNVQADGGFVGALKELLGANALV